MLTLVAGGGRKAIPAVTPTAGVATALRMVAQPDGAIDGDAFTTQPTVEVIDAYGDRVTGSSVEITAAKSSGSGTLGGDTAVNASSGLATFVDLEIVGTGSHALTFSATGLSSVTSSSFTVSAGAGGDITPLFYSDWSFATGSSSGATGDNGKWDSYNTSEDRVTVISTSGLGFPAAMANCLAIRNRGTNAQVADSSLWDNQQYCGVGNDGVYAAPGVGDHRYWRAYFRMSIQPDTDARNESVPDNTAHPWMPWAPPGFAQGVALVHGLGNPYVLRFGSGGHTWEAEADRDTTYRVEYHMHRVTTTTFTLDIRIYDESISTTVPVLGNADFTCITGSHSHTLATVGAGGHSVSDGGDLDTLTGASLTYEGDGWGPFTDAEGNRIYFGGFAVAATDWCGVYGHVTGEA